MPLLTASNALIHEEAQRCTILSIKYRKSGQPPAAALIIRDSTLDAAKRIADDTVKESGHICNGACKDWEVAAVV